MRTTCKGNSSAGIGFDEKNALDSLPDRRVGENDTRHGASWPPLLPPPCRRGPTRADESRTFSPITAEGNGFFLFFFFFFFTLLFFIYRLDLQPTKNDQCPSVFLLALMLIFLVLLCFEDDSFSIAVTRPLTAHAGGDGESAARFP